MIHNTYIKVTIFSNLVFTYMIQETCCDDTYIKVTIFSNECLIIIAHSKTLMRYMYDVCVCVCLCVLYMYYVCMYECFMIIAHSKTLMRYMYGVAPSSRLLKIVGLFCKRALLNRWYSAKMTCNFKEPTNRSHPIWSKRISWIIYVHICACVCVCVCVIHTYYVYTHASVTNLLNHRCAHVCACVCECYIYVLGVDVYICNEYPESELVRARPIWGDYD